MLLKRSSCTSILIGKKASADGTIMIGRNEDSQAAWPKHFVVHPHQDYAQPQKFIAKDTGLTLDLPQSWAKYTATPEWTNRYGLFEEDGINEYGVAMSATESAYSNARILGLDPLVPGGISEAAMITIVLPFVKTAKAGVLRLGSLISDYGTCESNGILFADHQEAWYLETAGGHQWVAQRIPDDSYAVVANQLAIQTIDFDAPDFLTAPTLQDFCLKNRLWQPHQPFNFREIFGTNDASDRVYNIPRVWDGQRYLSPSLAITPNSTLNFIETPDRPLFVEDAIAVLSRHFNETPFDPALRPQTADSQKFRPISLAKTQEAHVLQLRPEQPKGIGDLHWLAMGVAAESIFVPFYAGLTQTPASYQIGEMTFDPQSAYWQAKQLSVLVDSHYTAFMLKLQALQKQLFSQHLTLIDQTDTALKSAQTKTAQGAICTRAARIAAEQTKTGMQQLYSQLLIQATDASPLNFKTDKNL
ncbi:C69 family dipeptidase [Agrilactobacillus yilanensis]|uniref:Dipeptidase n=1 Tax=Agrilactobacillus yilanensis TaxID=2485997 RepID=A0ABW4J998_9LACO